MLQSILIPKGRGIESQSFFSFFYVLNQSEEAFYQKKRKSMKGSRNEEKREKCGRGERKRKDRHALQDTSRITRPQGLVCNSGLAIGYADDDQSKNEGSLRRQFNGLMLSFGS